MRNRIRINTGAQGHRENYLISTLRLSLSAFIVSFAILLNSCTRGPMERMEILLGEWHGLQDGNEFVETWKKVSDTRFTGKGAGLMNGDTVFREVLSIELIEGVPYYIANPDNQGAVHFRLAKEDKGAFYFENKEHDFPQEIIYSFKGEDSLLVQLLGMRDNEKAVQQLVFVRNK